MDTKIPHRFTTGEKRLLRNVEGPQPMETPQPMQPQNSAFQRGEAMWKRSRDLGGRPGGDRLRQQWNSQYVDPRSAAMQRYRTTLDRYRRGATPEPVREGGQGTAVRIPANAQLLQGTRGPYYQWTEGGVMYAYRRNADRPNTGTLSRFDESTRTWTVLAQGSPAIQLGAPGPQPETYAPERVPANAQRIQGTRGPYYLWTEGGVTYSYRPSPTDPSTGTFSRFDEGTWRWTVLSQGPRGEGERKEETEKKQKDEEDRKKKEEAERAADARRLDVPTALMLNKKAEIEPRPQDAVVTVEYRSNANAPFTTWTIAADRAVTPASPPFSVGPDRKLIHFTPTSAGVFRFRTPDTKTPRERTVQTETDRETSHDAINNRVAAMETTHGVGSIIAWRNHAYDPVLANATLDALEAALADTTSSDRLTAEQRVTLRTARIVLDNEVRSSPLTTAVDQTLYISILSGSTPAQVRQQLRNGLNDFRYEPFTGGPYQYEVANGALQMSPSRLLNQFRSGVLRNIMGESPALRITENAKKVINSLIIEAKGRPFDGQATQKVLNRYVGTEPLTKQTLSNLERDLQTALATDLDAQPIAVACAGTPYRPDTRKVICDDMASVLSPPAQAKAHGYMGDSMHINLNGAVISEFFPARQPLPDSVQKAVNPFIGQQITNARLRDINATLDQAFRALL